MSKYNKLLELENSIEAIPQLENWWLDYDFDELCSKVEQHLEVDDTETIIKIQDYLSYRANELDQEELIGF